jgi:predicted Zn-dependent protease
MVGGNLLDILQNIDAISSDYREEPGNRMPTLRIRDVQVSSGGE